MNDAIVLLRRYLFCLEFVNYNLVEFGIAKLLKPIKDWLGGLCLWRFILVKGHKITRRYMVKAFKRLDLTPGGHH